MRRLSSLLLGVLLLVTTGHANEVISSYTGGANTTLGSIVAGNSFTAASSTTFNSLGFIDVGSDGIAHSYPVGIFDTTTQTLLASATVTPASPLINGFRYASIPATIISAGSSFTIAAVLPTPTDPWVGGPTLSLGAGFTGAGTGQFVGGNTLTFPTSTDNVTYAVVNASGTIVPEPTALGLLGAAWLLLRRRR